MSRRKRKTSRALALSSRRVSRRPSFGDLGALAEPTVTSPISRGPLGIPKWGWLAAGGLTVAALIGVAFWKRKEIASMIGKGFDYAKTQAFATLLPAAAQPYVEVIVSESQRAGISPVLTAMLMERESRYGTMLSPPGPQGTGDAGHGRGLMQIDDRSQAAWLAANPWWEPAVNVRKGLEILKGKIAYLAATPKTPTVTLSEAAAKARGVAPGVYRDPRPLSGTLLYKAAVAAYNTGEGNVLMSVAANVDPDITSAGSATSGGRGDYGSAVLARAAQIEAALGIA